MNNKTYKISLLACLLVCSANMPADARISVKNSASYANAYNQVMAVRQQAEMANNPIATTASATATLPVMVDDEELAKQITNNSASDVSISDLETCSMIYPNGLFKWGYSESGMRKNQNSGCIAVVELRDVNSNAVLAQTTLLAGDTMKCNIDMFPQSGWQSSLEMVELPADAAPTIEEVEKVMDEEQKQNAGFKIAAAAILSGVAGNMLAPKEAGDTRLLGTGKQQLAGTALAAAGGAGIMAASTYSGKVAGDTIKSTAVNAATGAVIGNMAAGMSGTGDSVLNVQKCTIDGFQYDCVVGNIQTVKNDDGYTRNDDEIYLVNRDMKKCTRDKTGKLTTSCCSGGRSGECYNLEYNGNKYSCISVSRDALLQIRLTNNELLDEIRKEKHDSKTIKASVFDMEDSGKCFSPNPYPVERANIPDGTYFVVGSGSKPTGSKVHGYAVFDNLGGKLFGHKYSDWAQIQADYSPRYYLRNADGTVGKEKVAATNEKNDPIEEIVFTPISQSASDGALIDFQNSARTKATLSGAAAGGALGGFSAYQGAKQEVQDRWLAALREYNDSLDNFYCVTGKRPLSKYNDDVIIPEMKKSE